MAYPILEAEPASPDTKRLRVEAPQVARTWRPGQFVILRVAEGGERIPLTIAAGDDTSITLYVQAVGKTTTELSLLRPGDAIADVAGPLGNPVDARRVGRVAVVAGGVGAAVCLPTARAQAEAGNQVTAIVGARSAEDLILVDEMSEVADEVIVCTEDGTAGRRGLVTDVLAVLVDDRPPDLVVTAGPVAMMAAVADVTRPAAIPTLASLNPIMVDGTGMCGGCRVRVDDETRFVCVDGPELDAHRVDFDLLALRNTAYRAFEQRALAELRCRLEETGWEAGSGGGEKTGQGVGSGGGAKTGQGSEGAEAGS